MRILRTIMAAALLLLAGCDLVYTPQEHGPAWVNRSVDSLVEKLGKPDRQVRLPPPSLSVVYLYLGGAQPGFAICERDYFVRGATVIGYSEHGTDPKCRRTGGRQE